MGRTLLSDAFDLDFDFLRSNPDSSPKSKSRASDRSVRPTLECTTESHAVYCTVTATLAVWDNEPLAAVTVML